MKCANCPYWNGNECEFDDYWGNPPCEDPDPEPVRYTVFLFKGDEVFETDNWDEVHPLIAAYGDDVEVHDNWYGVCWTNGEWT